MSGDFCGCHNCVEEEKSITVILCLNAKTAAKHLSVIQDSSPPKFQNNLAPNIDGIKTEKHSSS